MAIQHAEKYYEIRRNHKDIHYSIIALNNIGKMSIAQGRYGKASKSLYKALTLAEESNDSSMIATICENLGGVYNYQGEFNTAKIYYQKAIHYATRINKQKTLSGAYSRLGKLHQTQTNFDSALYYHELATKINLDNNFNGFLISNYVSSALVYLKQENYEKSLMVLNLAKNKSRAMNSNSESSSIMLAYSHYYFYTENYTEAMNLYKNTLTKLEKEDNSSLSMMSYCYKGIYQANKELRNYDSALYYHELYADYKDSIYTIDKHKQIAELEAIYQSEKKEKEILKLEKDTEKKRGQMMLLASLIILLISLVIFVSFYYRSKQKAAVSKAIGKEQKKQFKAVLQAQDEERKRIAAELHDGVGPLLSVSQLYISELLDTQNSDRSDYYEYSKKSYDAIDEACHEIRDISHNLMPGVLVRMGLAPAIRELIGKVNESKAIQVSYTNSGYDNRLDESLEVSFYRVLQELFNNIIKHAQATKVEVLLKQDIGNLYLNVRDNGVGFKVDEIKSFVGIGLQSIYSRVSLLNGSVEVESGDHGTNFQIKAPLKIDAI